MTRKRDFAARRRSWLVLGPSVALFMVASHVLANDRRFAFVYEATTAHKGAVEFEQWFTWKTHKDEDSSFDRFEFRHEVELGITDRFQLGLYVSDWSIQNGMSVQDGATWNNVAIEGIYSLTDPNADPIGSALYGEVKIGDELAQLEGKFILQKDLGQWVFAWNGIIEAQWEGDRFGEDNGVLGQSLGASYQISPKLLAGFELLHEIEYEDWAHWGDHTVYLGPNVSYRNENWWLTAAPMFQVTDVGTEPDFQLRVLFGFDF